LLRARAASFIRFRPIHSISRQAEAPMNESNAVSAMRRLGAAAALSIAIACSQARDNSDDSTLARRVVPDSIVAADSAQPLTSADASAVESIRSRLDASMPLFRTPNAFTPLGDTPLSVRRDASQDVVAALLAPEQPDSSAGARYLYLFDARGMTAAVAKRRSDPSPGCAGVATIDERWMLRDGRLIGFDRILMDPAGQVVARRRGACPPAAGGPVVLYTSWPTLANAATLAALR
jgi:hypothetical protein